MKIDLSKAIPGKTVCTDRSGRRWIYKGRTASAAYPHCLELEKNSGTAHFMGNGRYHAAFASTGQDLVSMVTKMHRHHWLSVNVTTQWCTSCGMLRREFRTGYSYVKPTGDK